MITIATMFNHVIPLTTIVILLVGRSTEDVSWMVGSIDNDVTLQGHFDLSMSEFNYTKAKACLILNTDIGVMFIEAMLFAADQIIQQDLLYGLTLGINILDTCSHTKYNPYVAILDNSMALVGPYSSELSEFTTKFLSIFKLTEVSYGATAVKFTNREEYGKFFSTVPYDNQISNVYVSMAKRFHWEYTMMYYTQDEDSNIAVTLMTNFFNSRLCIASQIGIKRISTIKQYQIQIKKLINEQKVKVVFLMFSFKGCRDFFKAVVPYAHRLQSKQFVLGSTCGTMTDIPPSIRKYFQGILTIQVTDPQPEEFRSYFRALTPAKNTRNIYFKHYWQQIHNCTLTNLNATNYCTANENKIFNEFAPVRPVIDAVYSVVYGIRKAINRLCTAYPDKKECWKRKKSRVKSSLWESLNTINFTNHYNNETFRFENGKGSVTDSFDIFQYEKVAADNYKYKKVGFYDYSKYQAGKPALTFFQNMNITSSKCSVPCGPRGIKEIYNIQICRGCWKCKQCSEETVILNNTCTSCKLGFKANPEQTKCLQLPLSQINPTDPLSIVVMSVSAFGLVVASMIFVIYMKNYSSHIIKSTSRELALCSLFGLALMLITPLTFILEPNLYICYIQKIMIGLSLTCCYAPLVLKTNRIYRIFVSSSKFKLKRLMLVSMRSQFMMVMGMVGIELVMSVFWILTDIPAVVVTYPNNKYFISKSCMLSGMGGALNLIFPAGLMIASTFWAFKTRNLPESFSEIKSIGATMYMTLFLSTGAFALIIILQGLELQFAETYVLCFTLQAIVVVTLIGQYAMKIKSLYFGKELDSVNETQTEFTTVVMTNRFSSPTSSPKFGSNASRAMSLGTDRISSCLNGSLSSNIIGSPNSNTKRFSYNF